MISVLLKTDIKWQIVLDGSPVRYETFRAVLENPLTEEEDKSSLIRELEKAGDGFIQVTHVRGKDPMWIRASTVRLVKFIEVEETE